MSISLRKGSTRNTQSYIVHVGYYRLFFSYETCIAVIGGGERICRDNIWGLTTGRHINEWGAISWKIVEEYEIQALIKRAIVEAAGAILDEKLLGTRT